MDKLIELGINNLELKKIFDLNNNLINIKDSDIDNKYLILKNNHCDDNTIKNIIISNPMFLERSNCDIVKLINKLKKMGIKRLDITFENNPNLLNYDEFEIDNFIKEKEKTGYKLEDIIDLIDMGDIE